MNSHLHYTAVIALLASLSCFAGEQEGKKLVQHKNTVGLYLFKDQITPVVSEFFPTVLAHLIAQYVESAGRPLPSKIRTPTSDTHFSILDIVDGLISVRECCLQPTSEQNQCIGNPFPSHWNLKEIGRDICKLRGINPLLYTVVPVFSETTGAFLLYTSRLTVATYSAIPNISKDLAAQEDSSAINPDDHLQHFNYYVVAGITDQQLKTALTATKRHIADEWGVSHDKDEIENNKENLKKRKALSALGHANAKKARGQD